MKFFFIVLSICCYLISQTLIDARATGLRKPYWLHPSNSDYQRDIHRYIAERRRQAGWGKRNNPFTDDDYDEVPAYHPFTPQDNAVRAWFDDK